MRDRKRRAISTPKRYAVPDLILCSAIRVILALVAIQDMYLEQIDVKITFLHDELQEEIVME